MTTTPLMGLVLPTDHGSAETWDVILDTVFGLIDGHDHSTGKGGQVPMSGLKVNADLSFSFGGTSRAITDLRAIDFSPQPASGMTALAGALFLNSADSELYYRTVSGALIQLTVGAALNVAGFSGGIGGDYSAAGALVVFDDATDSYWFQQQLGASVRQYARMRSADVDLYEFKAVGVTPVPTNRVRLASPAGLAASYALTMPAVLPATGSGLVRISSTGAVTAAGTVWGFPSSLGAIGSTQIETISTGTQHASWQLGTSTQGVQFPVTLPAGCVISAWSWGIQKNSASGTVTGKLFSYTASTNTQTQIGATQSNAGVSTGFGVLGQSGLSEPVVAGTIYFVIIAGGGTSGDSAYDGQVTT